MTALASSVGPRHAVRSASRRRRSPALLLIAPSIVFMTLMFAWPMLVGIGQAFTGPDGFTLEHIQRMVADPYFWPAVRNTLWLIVVLVPLQALFAFGVALMLTRARWGVGLFRTVFYLPALVPPVVSVPETLPTTQPTKALPLESPLAAAASTALPGASQEPRLPAPVMPLLVPVASKQPTAAPPLESPLPASASAPPPAGAPAPQKPRPADELASPLVADPSMQPMPAVAPIPPLEPPAVRALPSPTPVATAPLVSPFVALASASATVASALVSPVTPNPAV